MRLFLLSLLFFPAFLRAQTTTNNAVIVVPCCDNADSIDYNLDGVFDIQLRSYAGIDNANFGATSLRSGISLASPVDSNAAFGNFNLNAGIAGTTMGCFGWSSWIPGTGGWRYIGFRDAINATDTTYGWVKVRFNGTQDSCNDTLITESVTYNTTINERLLAGEIILPSATFELPAAAQIQVFPNPADQYLHIRNEQDSDWVFSLSDAVGRTVWQPRSLRPFETQTIDLQHLPTGIYYLKITNNRQQAVYKIAVKAQ